MNKLNKIVDGMLVLQAQAGDKKAFSLLVKRWHIKLCRQAFWYIKDKDLAKDIAQDSWTVIFKKLGSIKEPNNFGAWALTLVNRKSIDWIRRHNRDRYKLLEYYENSKNSNKTVNNEESSANIERTAKDSTFKQVRDAILELPLKQQLILRLFYLDELSIIEIAQVLEISKGTVKSRLYYAREKLKLILKNLNHEK